MYLPIYNTFIFDCTHFIIHWDTCVLYNPIIIITIITYYGFCELKLHFEPYYKIGLNIFFPSKFKETCLFI